MSEWLSLPPTNADEDVAAQKALAHLCNTVVIVVVKDKIEVGEILCG